MLQSYGISIPFINTAENTDLTINETLLLSPQIRIFFKKLHKQDAVTREKV